MKEMEAEFGRRPGRRWGPRVLDLDLLAWDGGTWRSRNLSIPHVALEERVREGTFRRDLYFRLKVAHIVVPPLRERKEAILPIAAIFLCVTVSGLCGRRFCLR